MECNKTVQFDLLRRDFIKQFQLLIYMQESSFALQLVFLTWPRVGEIKCTKINKISILRAFKVLFLFVRAIPGLFFFNFVFSTVNSQNKILPTTRFEPLTSGSGSDCSVY